MGICITIELNCTATYIQPFNNDHTMTFVGVVVVVAGVVVVVVGVSVGVVVVVVLLVVGCLLLVVGCFFVVVVAGCYVPWSKHGTFSDKGEWSSDH